MTYAVFKRHQRGRLKIGSIAWAAMYRYRQNTSEKYEAGGVLLGRHILEADDIIVDSITEPMKDDQRERLRFFRTRQPHQEMVSRAWQESNGTCTYLGEWHTHPQQYPLPSHIDRSSWVKTLVNDQFTEPIFFVIVGITETRVWEGHRGGRLILLQRI